ncbi:ABC transporter permease [Bacillus chungangensis]|uniref:Glycine betaine/proline transport system permease protein n=2 Tax=Bacillus chungangensis TaxID=587633 RepID=A0ABT9WTZ1_9BACI|nr:proline/glycine betaine ABC transporter permease [Bacillus chungangensis]MDQ0176769.1 glycine betaine/proline transport system permease protein [Bacillus chungangensis]
MSAYSCSFIMSNFPDIKWELGTYIETFSNWVKHTFSSQFQSISDAILWFLLKIESGLLWVPWWSIILLVIIAGGYYRNIFSGIIYGFLLFLIGTFGYWELMMYTLAIVLASVFISIVLGVPFGILLSYNKRLETVMRPILDAMQTMPSFVYLIPAMMFFGMGKVPAVFATIIYALPPVIRLTTLAIRSVSKEMVEAAQSFGATTWQVLRKVQLPQAVPTIMTGISQTTMMALSMVVIASMVGAKGLGMEVLTSINRIDIGQGFESGIGIVFLAIIIDRISQGIVNKAQLKRKADHHG